MFTFLEWATNNCHNSKMRIAENGSGKRNMNGWNVDDLQSCKLLIFFWSKFIISTLLAGIGRVTSRKGRIVERIEYM